MHVKFSEKMFLKRYRTIVHNSPAEVQESREAKEKFREEFRKEKKTLEVEHEIRGKIISLATKLGENPACHCS